MRSGARPVRRLSSPIRNNRSDTSRRYPVARTLDRGWTAFIPAAQPGAPQVDRRQAGVGSHDQTEGNVLAAIKIGDSVQTALDSFFGFIPNIIGFLVIL